MKHLIIILLIPFHLYTQNVGINTTIPNEELHLKGDFMIENGLMIHANLMNNIVVTDGFYNTEGYGQNNLVIGVSALASLGNDENSIRNTAIGINSLFRLKSGIDNSSIGANTLFSLDTGWSNTSTGSGSLYNLTSGSRNTAIGTASLSGLGQGSDNVAIGASAGSQVSSSANRLTLIGAATSAAYLVDHATAIGYGAYVLKDSSVVIGGDGMDVGLSAPDPDAQLSLGRWNSGYSGKKNQILISGAHNQGVNNGSSTGTYKLRIEGYNNDGPVVYPIIAIDENNQVDFYVRNRPSASGDAFLFIDGIAIKPGGGSWSASSDRRLKQNINPYDKGLSEIESINPISFQYNTISGYNTDKVHVGVIAQELQQVAPSMISNHEINGEAYLQVENGEMIYMLINAVKELAAENKVMKKELDNLKAQVGQFQGIARVK